MKPVAPIVFKCCVFLTFLIGFVLNIFQLMIFFDFSHKIGEELLQMVGLTYLVYFWFLSVMNSVMLVSLFFDYIRRKLDARTS